MKALFATVIALALLAPVSADLSSAQAAAVTAAAVKVKATGKPTRHWLSDGLQGLSLLLPRHAAQSHNNG